jgi:hypothetical protein
MKQVITILLFIFIGFNCRISQNTSTFDHFVKKSTIKNPSFAIFIERGNYNSYNNWLANEIEKVLLSNNVTLYAVNINQVVNKTAGEIKDASSNTDSTSLSKGELNFESTLGLNQIETKATYLFKASYDAGAFKIISIKTQEIIASGTFTGLYSEAIKNNINILLREMGINE